MGIKFRYVEDRYDGGPGKDESLRDLTVRETLLFWVRGLFGVGGGGICL